MTKKGQTIQQGTTATKRYCSTRAFKNDQEEMALRPTQKKVQYPNTQTCRKRNRKDLGKGDLREVANRNNKIMGGYGELWP